MHRVLRHLNASIFCRPLAVALALGVASPANAASVVAAPVAAASYSAHAAGRQGVPGVDAQDNTHIGRPGIDAHDHGHHEPLNNGSPGTVSGPAAAAGPHNFGALMRGEAGHNGAITLRSSGKAIDVSGDGFLQLSVPHVSTARGRDAAHAIAPSNGFVTLDAAALHQAARAVVNTGGESRSVSGRSGAILLGGEPRAAAGAQLQQRGKLTAEAPSASRVLNTMPATLVAAPRTGRPDDARHVSSFQPWSAPRLNQTPANITSFDPQTIIISETAPTRISHGISIINVTALDAMLAAGNVTLDAGSIRLAPGAVLTWMSASALTLDAAKSITILGGVSAPNGLLTLIASGALTDTATSMIGAAGISIQAGSVALAGSWTTSGGPIAIAGVNAVTLAPSATIAANGAQGGSVQIGSSQGAVQISGRVSATGATGKGGAISITGANVTILGALIDASGASGGNVSIVSNGNLTASGTVLAVGSDPGQSGGFVETSGQTVQIGGQVNAGQGGTWLLDPNDLTIGSTLAGTIDTALNAGTSVTEQTTASGTGGFGDITVASPLTWSTSASLTLSAYRNVNVDANITSSGGGGVTLFADNSGIGTGTVNFGSGNQASTSGAVSIFYNPTGNNNSTINITSYTNPTNYSGNIANGGTLSAFMLVNTVYDLQNVENNLTGTYALGNNIDATATAGWNANAGFAPIGTVALPFNGTFDGLDHTVTDLTVNLPATADVGLFGSTGTASTIRNVGLIGGSVIGLSSAGGLVGSNTGTISNSSNTGNVSGGSSLGGLMGSNTGTVSFSSTTGSVNGTSSLGGLMGSNTGTVSFSSATGNVSGTSSLGGLMGSNTGTVSNSYATGNVTGTSSLGGLMGSSTTGLVSNSYATGNVSGTTSVGGLMGSSTGPVIDTYATGAVTGTAIVGGLMGSSSGSVSNSYWNIQTSGQSTSPGGTGLTSVQMLQSANFNTWDFVHTWIIYNGLTDPLLQSFMTPLAVTANNATQTYNGQPYSGGNGVSYSSAPTGNLLGTVNYTGTSQGAVNVGNYVITPGGLYSNQQGYLISYVGGTLAVTAAPLTVTADAQSRIYGAANPTLTYTDTGLLNGDTLSGALATTATTTSNVGPYAITQGTLAASANYALSYVGANLTVTAAPLTVTANAQTMVYGGTVPTLTYVSSGLVNGDTLSGLLATTASTTSNVGNYGITQGTLAASSNYALNYVGANLAVTAAPLTVTANAQSRIYGNANPTLTYVSSGLLNGDTLTGALATTATVTSNIGAYAITQGTLANSNYSIAYTGANLTVTAAALTVTANAQTMAYGSAVPALTYVSSGLVNGDTLSGLLATTATTTSNVGNYGISQGTLAASANYALSYVGANLTVTAAPLTVTASAQSMVYGSTVPALTYVSSGLVNGDTLSGLLATTATGTSNVGNYAITQGTLAASANYALSYVGANLTVTAAPLTVTANAQSRIYGGANPTLTYTATGLLNGDTLSGLLATTATGTSNVGNYGISQGTLAASANYALSYVGANLTVTAAPLTVTANAQSMVYGSTVPALTYVSSGLVNGDTLSGLLATTATVTSNVGNYAITQGTLAASANYALSYVGANLTVTAAPLTVTADAQSRLYGAAKPTLTYTDTGQVNGDTLSGLLATTATATSNVGNNAITQGTLAASANYALTYVGANLTVTAAALTVTASAQSMVYGSTVPALTYIESGLVNGDTLAGALATTATTTSNVGNYGISQGTLAASANYALSYVGANLTVTAALLTVTANVQSMVYGSTVSALTYVSSGLLNGDTLSGLLATSATATSNVGNYGITQGTLAASANYALSYVGANIAVTAAPLTVSANVQSRIYGAADPTLTYTEAPA